MKAEETVKKILAKYRIEEVGEVLSASETCGASKIAFLGEFSAGKTSLINKLLGTNLPVATVPTTKNICLIEPTEDLPTGEFRYFSEGPNGSLSEIGAMDFDDIVLSDKERSNLIIKAPPSDYLPMGTIIVDTPGEGSLSSESDITAAYLSQADAAVFCIPLMEGTVHKTVLDFLSSPILSRIHSRIVFALTMSDLANTPESVARIRANVIETLHQQAAAGRFKFDDLESRVVTVSTKDEAESLRSGLLPVLKRMIFDQKEVMANERREIIAKNLSGVVASVLMERYDAMRFDSSDLVKREEMLEVEAKQARDNLMAMENRFAEFRQALPDRMANVFEGYVGELLSAKEPDELNAAASRLADEIRATISRLAKTKLKVADLAIDQSWVSRIELMLPDLLARIDRTARGIADMAFIAASAGLAEFVAGGATALGGAARGAATVSGREAAKMVAKTAQETAKSVKATAEAAKVAAEAAKTAKRAAIIGKTAKILSQVLDSVNPASYVADWTSPMLRQSVIDRFKSELISQADTIADLAWEDYASLVIEPAQSVCEAKKKLLIDLADESDAAHVDYKTQKEEILKDVQTLRDLSSMP